MYLKKLILWSIGTLASIFLISATVIAVDGLHDCIKVSDVGIVFGNKVHPDGRASARLAARLDKAVELYNDGFISHVIVSGGVGKEGVDEAIAMRQYLVSREVPAAAIWVDSTGNTTADTAKNSVKIMRQQNYKSALLISQYFHISRARLAFHQCGMTTIYTAHPSYFEWRDFYSLAREVIGFYAYLVHL